jgi:hypothetical protein
MGDSSNDRPVKIEGAHTVTHTEIPVRFINTSQFTEEFIAAPIRKMIAEQVAFAFREVTDDLSLARRVSNRPIGHA